MGTSVIESSEEDSTDPDQDDSKDYVVKKSVVKKVVSKVSDTKDKKVIEGVQALKKKYTEQRLAKHETLKKSSSKSLPARKTRSQSQDSTSSPERRGDTIRNTRSQGASSKVLVKSTLRKPSNAAIIAKKKSKLAVAKIVQNGRGSRMLTRL